MSSPAASISAGGSAALPLPQRLFEKRISEMNDGERCLTYLYALYWPYSLLPDGNELRIELRCNLPKWANPGQWNRMIDIQWFPITHAGIWQAAKYIALNRDFYDIFNSLHPRRGNSYTFDSSPYFAMIPCDLDAKGDRGGPAAADAHFVRMVKEHGVLNPHLAVQGRSGFHLYWMLDGFYDMDGEEARRIYEKLMKRVCRWVSGPPDEFNLENGKPIWHGPVSDIGPSSQPSGTLRPAGSLHHGYKEGDTPIEVRLVLHRPNGQRFDLDFWRNRLNLPATGETVNVLSDEFQRRKSLMEDGLMPHERRRIPRRTREYLAGGADTDSGQNHQKLLTTVTDLAWSGYTQEEALQIMVQHVCRGQEDERKFRSLVFQSPGKKFQWNDQPCQALPEIRVW